MAVMTAFLVSPAPGDFHVPSANAGIVCPEARVMVGPPAPTLAFFAAGSDIFGLKDGTSWMYPKRKRCVDDRNDSKVTQNRTIKWDSRKERGDEGGSQKEEGEKKVKGEE